MNKKLTAVRNVVTSKAGLSVLKMKKNSPTIMFAAGVVGVGVTVVLACRATLRVEEDVLEDHAMTAEAIHAVKDANPESVSDTDVRRELAKNYGITAFKLVKLYGPCVIVGAASIGLLTSAHVTLQRRNAGLTAAYITLMEGFDQYRARVRADVGPEKDLEYRFGVDPEGRQVYSEAKNGEPKVNTIKTFAGASDFARLFNDGNKNWNPSPDYNLIFLRRIQNYLNDQLEAHGTVLLNDAYVELGFDRTEAGAVLGWSLAKEGPAVRRINFGIWDDDRMETLVDFMLGREDNILVDFNVDGPVHHFL